MQGPQPTRPPPKDDALYKTLGAAPGADSGDIKRAYRKKMAEAHPDKPEGSHEKAQAVNGAYLILSDPQKRAKYDASGSVDDGLIDDGGIGAIAEVLVSAFEQAMARVADGELDYTDVAAAAKEVIIGFESNLVAAKANCNVRIRRCRRILKRLKFKGDGPDFVTRNLQMTLADAAEALANMNKQLAYIREAKIMANSYSYATDTQPSPTYSTAYSPQRSIWDRLD